MSRPRYSTRQIAKMRDALAQYRLDERISYDALAERMNLPRTTVIRFITDPGVATLEINLYAIDTFLQGLRPRRREAHAVGSSR